MPPSMNKVMQRSFSVAVFLFAMCGFLLGEAPAQQNVGIVTALKGQAQLTRAGVHSGLRFKDNLILRDTVDTATQSSVRILFGAKSTLTLRELSHFEVREEVLSTGASRTHYSLSSGAGLVHVVRQLMNAGDEVQIQTPNAVAAVRGTTIHGQYRPELAQTTFTLLTGNATVTPEGLAPFNLTAGTSVTITGDATTGIVVGPIRAITQGETADILRDADLPPAVKQEGGRDDTLKELSERAGKEPIETGSVQCRPYPLCELQPWLGGTFMGLPRRLDTVIEPRPVLQVRPIN
jgi:hypothetical protein